MNMKRIIPGLLAAFILMAASSANAGGANWSFSVNLHNGHPTFGIHVGQKRHYVRHKRANHRRNHHKRRPPVRNHRNYGHRHGHSYHSHHHRGAHRHGRH